MLLRRPLPRTSRALSATEPAAKASTSAPSFGILAILAATALFAIAADQFSKYLVVTNLTLGEYNQVLGEFLQFVFVKNSGAAFSFASGSTWIFSIAASVVAIFIVVFARRIRSWVWALLFGMLLGGTLGNLIDRLFREPSFGQGHVVDFISVAGFPAIFNVADIFIVSSMGLFIILTVRGVRLDGTRATAADDAPAPETTDDTSTPR